MYGNIVRKDNDPQKMIASHLYFYRKFCSNILENFKRILCYLLFFTQKTGASGILTNSIKNSIGMLTGEQMA
jgi:hypothetical protein